MAYTNTFYRLRWVTLERDNFTCQYCGASAPDVVLWIDHRVPVSEGGTDDPNNLVTACIACNLGKGKGSKLRVRPKRTRRNNKKTLIPRLVAYLEQYQPARATDIAAHLNLHPSNISRTLNKEEPFVAVEKVGRDVFYALESYISP